MSYTKYGEYIRILRIKYHEVMGDLANVLDTSLPLCLLLKMERRMFHQPGYLRL